MVGGSGTDLDPVWYEAFYQYCVQQAKSYPNDINLKYAEASADLKLLSFDVANLLARTARNTISGHNFAADATSLDRKFDEWEKTSYRSLYNPASLIDDLGSPLQDPEDIVNPYTPNILYGDQFWTTNIGLLDFWGLKLNFKYQTAVAMKMQPGADLVALAYKVCQLYEAVTLYHQSPPAMVIANQASLCMACLFLPTDERHNMWCRRKMAAIERHGFILPATLRERMAQAWGDGIRHWWLPNDEGYPRLIQSIRAFIDDRIVAAPQNQYEEDVREMKGLFEKLKISEL